MDNENKEVENEDNTGKVANTVEKFQKRLDKLTGDKHDLEEELANAKVELEEYKLGKKIVKKLSEEG